MPPSLGPFRIRPWTVEPARNLISQGATTGTGDANVRLSRAWILGAEERREEALAELADLEAALPNPPYLALARSYIFLGELDGAGRLFDEAARLRLPATILLASHPGFAPLLDDPRMRAFRESIGLPAEP